MREAVRKRLWPVNPQTNRHRTPNTAQPPTLATGAEDPGRDLIPVAI